MLKFPRFKEGYREQLKGYKERVLNYKGVVGILLYSSLAKGTQRLYPESDVDVIVVCENLPDDLYERRALA